MDVETSSLSKNKETINKDGRSNRSHKLRNILLAVSALIVFILIVLMILALTILKPKHPKTTVNSVSLEDFDVGLSRTKLKVDLNVTLGVDLSINNPNKVSFKYGNNTALLNYMGDLIGEASIPAGHISADQTKPMNITLTIMVDRLLSKSKLYSDVLAGTLPLNTFTKISGKVTILGFIKFKVVSTTSCDFRISVSNRSVENQNCSYKTKL